MVIKFLTYWLAFSIICITIWINHNFGSPIIEQIIFQLKFAEPLEGTFPPNIVFLFVKSAFIYPIFLAVLIFYLERIIVFIFKNLPIKLIINSKLRILLSNIHVALFVFSLILFAKKFSLDQYIGFQLNKRTYNSNYFAPDPKFITPENKKNLVLIYMESIEETYRNKELFKKNLLLSLDNIDGLRFNKYKQLPGTGWTIAGIFSTQCGEYLKLSFLEDNNTCLTDILSYHGYYNVYMQGASLDFTKTGEFLKKHQYHELYGREEWKKQGVYEFNAWGLYDDDLFEQAKIKLKSLQDSGNPFNLTILTVDTHFPNGYLSNYCKEKNASSHEEIIECSADQVANFIQFIKDSGYLKNTNIVVIGDHLYPFRDHSPIIKESDRSILNLFISESLPEKNRDEIIHFDLLPSILEFIGFKVEGGRLGLGQSFFKKEKNIL